MITDVLYQDAMDQGIQQANFSRTEGNINFYSISTYPRNILVYISPSKKTMIYISLTHFYDNSASGCPIAAKNKGKSGYEGMSSLSKYGPSSSSFGPYDQSTEHMMGVDVDKDKNRMDTSDPMDEKVCISAYPLLLRYF